MDGHSICFNGRKQNKAVQLIIFQILHDNRKKVGFILSLRSIQTSFPVISRHEKNVFDRIGMKNAIEFIFGMYIPIDFPFEL